nr:hypothetical protein [Tessaracoccus aquimaris]
MQEGPTEVADDSRSLGWSVGCRVLLKCSDRILVEHRTEDPSQVTASYFIILDIDALEHSLIEVTPDLRIVTAEVATVGPVKVLERDVQRSMEAFVIHLGLSQLGLNHSSLNGDPALLLLQEIDWQCIRVVGLHQLIRLRLELRQTPLCGFACHTLFVEGVVDVVSENVANLSQLARVEFDRRPVVLDELFKMVGLNRDEGAAVLPGLATKAVEVLVVVAHAVARDLIRQGLPTLATEDTPLQVVRSDLWLLLALATTATHCLTARVQLLADQRFVLARILDPLEGHHAGVVAVHKELVDVRSGDGAIGSLRRW